ADVGRILDTFEKYRRPVRVERSLWDGDLGRDSWRRLGVGHDAEDVIAKDHGLLLSDQAADLAAPQAGLADDQRYRLQPGLQRFGDEVRAFDDCFSFGAAKR